MKLKKNAPINLMVVPQGGGGGVVQAIVTVAIVVAAVYTGGLAAGAMGFAQGTLGYVAVSAITSMAVTMVANTVMNSVFPPPAMSSPTLSTNNNLTNTNQVGTTSSPITGGAMTAMPGSGGGNSVGEAPQYGWTAGNNSGAPYQPIPRVYGKIRMAPAYAASPYVDSYGGNQYLFLLFTFGYGPLDVKNIRIGENPISSYEGATYLVHENFQAWNALTYYNKDQYQASVGQVLNDVDWRDATTVEDTNSATVDFQFPGGLGSVDKFTGNLVGQTVDIRVEIKKDGESTWSNFTNFPHFIHGEGIEKSGAIQVGHATQRPFFSSLQITFPSADKYYIRAKRTTPPSLDRYIVDGVSFATIKSTKNSKPIKPPVGMTVMELKIKANDQLNGSINNLTAEVTSILPTWDGTKFVDKATRNPAWAYLDILRGTAAIRKAPDSRIDLDSIKEWADWCDAPSGNSGLLPKCQCDVVVSGNMTAWQTLKLIASTGDATPSMRSGKYSVAIDRERDYAIQMFTPRNSWGFQSQIEYHQQPHALRVSYIDPTQEWSQQEITVYDDGYSVDNATLFESLDLIGITNYHHAYRIGRRTIAQGKLRNETFTITTGVENLLATRGDLVSLTYDVPSIGIGWGRITRIDSARYVTLDAPFSAIAVGYYLKIRVGDGTQQDFRVSEILSDTQVKIDGDTSDLAVGQLLSYGEMSRVAMECIVKSVQPSNDLEATLELINYAPAIYTAETETIPPYDPLLTDISKLRPNEVQSLQSTLTDTVINRYHYLSVGLSWVPSIGVTPHGYAIYEQQGTQWNLIGQTKDCVFFAYKDLKIIETDGTPIDLIGKTKRFAVSAIGFAGTRIDPSIAAQVSVEIIGDAERPPAPTTCDLNVVGDTTFINWTPSPVNDIDRYEIRYSPEIINATWNDAVPLKTSSWEATGTSVPSRIGSYFIKVVDTTGNKSSALLAGVITENPNADDLLVNTIVESPTFPGELFGAIVDEDAYLTLDYTKTDSHGFFGEYLFKDSINMGSKMALRLVDTSSCTHGASGNKIFMSEWGLLSDLDSMTAAAKMREVVKGGGVEVNGWFDTFVQVDGGDWQRLTSGTFVGTEFKFKIQMHCKTVDEHIFIGNASIAAYAPSRIESKNNLAIPVAGLSVKFDQPFFEAPSVTLNIDDQQSGDYWIVSNKTAEGFTINAKNADAAVARQMDFIARGVGAIFN